MNQFRFQQQYLSRLQQIRILDTRYYNNNRNLYFYAASNYRYSYGGNYYDTNQYGVTLLRSGVNYGYEQGYRAGQADRQDNWASSYQDSYAYQQGDYGYGGYYVNQSDYSYYFREGFRRGYEDGFNGRYQYGSYSNGTYAILGAVSVGILALESIR